MSLNIWGNDINKLVQLLEEKLYIRKSWVSKKDGFMLYDSKVEEAVKHYQRDAGITQSGQIEKSTLQALKDWDKQKTTAILGVRDLYYIESQPMCGYDVDELVTLLSKKGLTPDSPEIEKKNGHAVFTKDIEMAVKMYQSSNGMPDTGKVDETFVKTIKGHIK
jgi:murein L,D-transpeptidase YcbB/YkuD